jgi:P27 family predicted phage terminase small subunit
VIAMGGNGSGRTRRPTALRGIDGGKMTGEPKPDEAKAIRRPATLSDGAKPYWNRYAPDLIKQNVLTPWDVPLFEKWCEANAQYDAARERIKLDGLVIVGRQGGLVKHPMTTIQKEAVAEIKSIGAKFGMSPSDRGGLEVKPPAGKLGLAEFL